jgi:hypothetical protein
MKTPKLLFSAMKTILILACNRCDGLKAPREVEAMCERWSVPS